MEKTKETRRTGKETKVPIQFGAIPVELPDLPDVPLHLVVVKGFGTHPMVLLTTLAEDNTYGPSWSSVSTGGRAG